MISPSRSRALTTSWIGRLRIRASDPTNMCRTLSGGNQQKIVFAKWLARNVNVLICDDPGRGLDVGAKEDIYQLLRELAKDGRHCSRIGQFARGDQLVEPHSRLAQWLGLGRVEAPKDAKPREVDVLPAML